MFYVLYFFCLQILRVGRNFFFNAHVSQRTWYLAGKHFRSPPERAGLRFSQKTFPKIFSTCFFFAETTWTSTGKKYYDFGYLEIYVPLGSVFLFCTLHEGVLMVCYCLRWIVRHLENFFPHWKVCPKHQYLKEKTSFLSKLILSSHLASIIGQPRSHT